MLARGTHVVHELAKQRSAWVHLIEGEITLEDLVLCGGDGVGLSAERVVSLTAHEASELLVIDLGSDRKDSSTGGGP
jgi:redox-sensitive bicupin YhaK (pirin superfamily)